jgi:hypothetical protein
MLAAALIESLDWWFDHESITATEIDTAFHSMARTVIANGSKLALRGRVASILADGKT